MGKVHDEWFMQLSHKYEVEQMEQKAKVAAKTEHNNLNSTASLWAVRIFPKCQATAVLHRKPTRE